MDPAKAQCGIRDDESARASRLEGEQAHAFKNIFSIILANAAMIAEESGEGALLHRRLERIVTACQRGEALVATLRGPSPASAVPPAAVRTTTGAEERGQRLQGRILVVDDEPDVVEIICYFLLRVGLEIYGMSDSLKAVELLSDPSFPCDLVLTDLDMPSCDGIELCRRLHTLRPELPVVLMSGYGESITPHEMQQWRVRDLLCKPVDRQLLVATIARVLSS